MGKRALREALLRSRQYTNAMVADLSDAQWRVPMLPTINPLSWELGHVGWFMERWCLRGDPAQPSLLPNADGWYDSSSVAHADRWQLPLPTRAATATYIADVLAATLDALDASEEFDQALYFYRLALAHECMHAESIAQTRQTLGYSPPALPAMAAGNASDAGEVEVDAGRLVQGVERAAGGFVFDNEKWAHPVAVAPFAIDRRPISNGEFLQFVEADGYRRPELWDRLGQQWLAQRNALHPVYWRCIDGEWQQRVFDRWIRLPPDDPLMHVTAHEAAAYCRWRQRRLPSEAEWELAATSEAIGWGNAVWEWTSTPFAPYPGFAADDYRDYSLPWFHTHRGVRGASVATPPELKHPKFRNFYLPERADVFIGFRTCQTLD